MANSFSPKLPGGVVGWLLQRLTAALIFGIVIIHLLVIHYRTPGESVTFGEIVERVQNPLFFGLWIALLACGLFHALYGVRMIILDFVPVKDLAALTRTLVVIGALVFALGVLLLILLLLGRPLFGT